MGFTEVEFQKEKFIQEFITSSYLCYRYVILLSLKLNAYEID